MQCSILYSKGRVIVLNNNIALMTKRLKLMLSPAFADKKFEFGPETDILTLIRTALISPQMHQRGVWAATSIDKKER